MNSPCYPTRHRGVLKLIYDVPLYDTRNVPTDTFRDIIEASKSAQIVMKVRTLCTDLVEDCEDDDTKYLMDLYLFSSTGSVIKTQVLVPKDWTPRMYLGAIFKSVSTDSIISFENEKINDKNYTTINNIQWLFSTPPETTEMNLHCSASYFNVRGGEHFYIPLKK